MKKIALLADGWRRYVTYSWIEGIMGGSKELGLDLCLYFYSTNGTWSHDPKFNSGEYALYDLPDLNSFDGVIFDCTNTTDLSQIHRMLKMLSKVKVPVVSIGYKMDGFYYVGNDNKRLLRKVMDHMYYEHNCRSYVFAGGPAYNYENRVRFEAFKEALCCYGIPLTEDMYMFGEFDYQTGVRYMSEWHEKKRQLPDVFVCANDNIAAGMCAAAEALGYRVPQDFKVTGFDNLDKAAYFNPQITTVDHNRGNIGRKALEILKELWNGTGKAADKFLDSEFIPAESCGCPNNGMVDYRNYIKEIVKSSVTRAQEEDAVMILQNELEECNDFYDLFKKYSDYIQTMKCDGVYAVVVRDLSEASTNAHFRKKGYDADEEVVLFAEDKESGRLEFQSVQELMQYMESAGETTCFMHCSLHFRDDIVGYVILRNPEFLYDHPEQFDIQSALMKKLENLFKQKVLENTNEELKNLYNRDALTGLYNRVACNEMVIPQFDRLAANNVGCTIVFLDVDDFKDINDTYGHKYGDNLLRTVAGVLDEQKPSGSTVYRFGGDEFIVFIPGEDHVLTEKYIERVYNIMEQHNMYISHGIIYTKPGSGKSFDDYLVIADKQMYSFKQHHKKERKSSFLKGVDISSIPQLLDNGIHIKDKDGNVNRVFDLLKANNIDSVRLRIWNEPGNVPESGGYCSLAYVLEMAHVIKKYNMNFMLDFHYSDYWADPGQQNKPKAWNELSFEELKAAVYKYTHDVLYRLKIMDCAPDMVQIGNEIRSGMLFPDGAVPNFENLAELVNEGIRATRELLPEAQVMIHLDQGGRFDCLKLWFDAMFEAGMQPIDAIGISYYPFWHGTYMDLKHTMSRLIQTYELPVYIVETAYPWRHCEGEHISAELMESAGLKAGKEEQKKALEIMLQIAAEASKETGKTGVYYWEPVGVPDCGFGSWFANMGMFDTNGRALCGWEAFRDFDPKKLPIEDLDKCLESLYEFEESKEDRRISQILEKGNNLLSNSDFANGCDEWQIDTSSSEVKYNKTEEGLFISSDANFDFIISQTVDIAQTGKYMAAVDYRGTNTTGVEVSLFVTVSDENGVHTYSEEIFPADIRFVTHVVDNIEIKKNAKVTVGLKIHTPPVFAKIKRFSLVVI